MGGRGADSGEVWVELCRRGLQTLTLFKTKITHFATLLSGESGGGARGTRPPLSLDQIKNSNNISRLDMIALFKAYRHCMEIYKRCMVVVLAFIRNLGEALLLMYSGI